MNDDAHFRAGHRTGDGQPEVLLCLQRLMGSSLPFKARLGDRLTVLSTAFAEDYKGGCLSPGAIDALVNFLEADASIGYPDLTATPAGGLYAEWPGAHGGRATIEFLASGGQRTLKSSLPPPRSVADPV
jgi:hypothetical protein